MENGIGVIYGGFYNVLPGDQKGKDITNIREKTVDIAGRNSGGGDRIFDLSLTANAGLRRVAQNWHTAGFCEKNIFLAAFISQSAVKFQRTPVPV